QPLHSFPTRRSSDLIFARAQESGANYEKAISAALEAVLTSPHFLFRIEARDRRAAKRRQGDQFALASRMSYFLWSTMPDDELLEDRKSTRLNSSHVS